MRPSGYGISLSPNLFYNLEGDKVVYFAAGVGVVHDDESARQKYFLRHDDDIECLSMHEDGDTIASGQYGVEPTVWIWSAKTRQGPRATPSGPGGPDLPGPIKLVLPRGERSVIACCFSPHFVGDKLVTVSTDAQHTVRVWNWSEVVDCTKCTGTGLFNRDTCPLCDGAKKQTGVPMDGMRANAYQGTPPAVYGVVWNPHTTEETRHFCDFVTFGAKHMACLAPGETVIVLTLSLHHYRCTC